MNQPQAYLTTDCVWVAFWKLQSPATICYWSSLFHPIYSLALWPYPLEKRDDLPNQLISLIPKDEIQRFFRQSFNGPNVHISIQKYKHEPIVYDMYYYTLTVLKRDNVTVDFE